MNDIALTPEYLEHLLALGKAVPPGPWGTYLNATELFGHYFPDWGTIYANVERRGRVLEGCVIATVNRNFISDEDRAAAWEKDKTGEKVDPGLSGKIAAYIAAYHPGVTTALIMEILRLRAEVERLKEENEAHRVVTANFQRITENLAGEIDDNEQEVEEHIAYLEAQIDFLAKTCARQSHDAPDEEAVNWWRAKAREAAEKKA